MSPYLKNVISGAPVVADSEDNVFNRVSIFGESSSAFKNEFFAVEGLSVQFFQTLSWYISFFNANVHPRMSSF